MSANYLGEKNKIINRFNYSLKGIATNQGLDSIYRVPVYQDLTKGSWAIVSGYAYFKFMNILWISDLLTVGSSTRMFQTW